MPNLCIIPARGGSKRIPNKNIKDFLGKPIISYSIKSAIETGLFDEIMVSTDDTGIAEISKSLGAKVPFLRSEENSQDFSTTYDVIEEVIKQYDGAGKHFEKFCCIYPCAPLIVPKLISQAKEILNDKDIYSVIPIVEYGHPIQRALRINSKTLEMVFPEHSVKRTQDLPPSFHDAGQFYWAKTENLLKEKTLYTSKSGYLVLSELEAQDIDTPVDWAMAEIKYRLLHA